MRKRKYRMGNEILSMGGLDGWLKADGWCYFGTSTRPKHPSIIRNMSFLTLSRAIERKVIYMAVINTSTEE